MVVDVAHLSTAVDVANISTVVEVAYIFHSSGCCVPISTAVDAASVFHSNLPVVGVVELPLYIREVYAPPKAMLRVATLVGEVPICDIGRCP